MKELLPVGKASYFFMQPRENRNDLSKPKTYSGNLILDTRQPEVIQFMERVQAVMLKVKEGRAVEEIDARKIAQKEKEYLKAKIELVYPWKHEIDDQEVETGRIILSLRRKEGEGSPQFLEWNPGPDGKPQKFKGAMIQPGSQIQVVAEKNPNYMMASNKVFCTLKLHAVRIKSPDNSELFDWSDAEPFDPADAGDIDGAVPAGVDGSEF